MARPPLPQPPALPLALPIPQSRCERPLLSRRPRRRLAPGPRTTSRAGGRWDPSLLRPLLQPLTQPWRQSRCVPPVR